MITFFVNYEHKVTKRQTDDNRFSVENHLFSRAFPKCGGKNLANRRCDGHN